MSKRDDDASDMDVGMTTAERRRRRRRGGGLRVPSDNVPRRTTPPVVAPVPEDPSLAMSIAYSFTSDASEPVPRVTVETPVPSFDSGPIAPEAMATVIDPPEPIEEASFEMKTREMSAVDLQALGLEEPGAKHGDSSGRFRPRSPTDPGAARSSDDHASPPPRDEPAVIRPLGAARAATEPGPKDLADRLANAGKQIAEQRAPRERLKTMALSEDDLEEVREAVRAASSQPAVMHPVVPQPVANHPAPVAAPSAPSAPSATTAASSAIPSITATQPLSALDLEPAPEEKSEPISMSEIDINDLAERAESSGEFEVDVDDMPITASEAAQPAAPAPAAQAAPSPSSAPGDRRSRPPSAPPPIAPAAATTNPGASTHAHPPPPPTPPAHKAPPAPPPKAKAAAVAAAVKAPSEPKVPRGKPWFVDLFDEDYLRTLPFLTPQATQSEAEFVIEAMGLSAGAQVLDVGCGYGRHAMELAARGFHVVGLDLSTPLLVRGGEEAQRRGLEINFVRGDMRELDFDSQFDGAYCLFSTFGYFDDETNKKTIANIARALKPGGRVMIEILNRDYVIADLPTRVWWEGEGCVVLEEVDLNYFSSRIQVNRSVVFDDGRQLEQEISVRAYSLHEVGKLMHAAGFRVLEVSGGYHTRGRFFGNQSRHIIVLAERKDPSTT